MADQKITRDRSGSSVSAGPRVVSAVLIVLGVLGMLTSWQLFAYYGGPVEQLTVGRCGTYVELLGEVAEKPGTWCLMPGYYVTETVGVAHSDHPQTVTAMVTRGPTGAVVKIYRPTPGDVVLLAGSIAGILAGAVSQFCLAVLARRPRPGQ